MEHRQLGRSDIRVSALCLGTMTFGEQNTEAESHDLMDRAVDGGIDFLDTAEMYAVPVRAETYGRSEEIVGTWLQRRARRDDVIVATKVLGPGDRFPYVRDGAPRLDRRNIERAIDDSLRRLRTDYVDLYQLHWPHRSTNYFSALGYTHDPAEDTVPIEETLGVLDDLVRAGKARAIGVSNETPWGVMRFLHLAETTGQPRIVSVQNPYSLLNRVFEIGLAEPAMREQVGLLAYSPLGGGTLTGKYLDGARPPKARFTLYPGYFPRYETEQAIAAIPLYVALARRHGLDPAQMALAFVTSRPFLTSTIVGVTTAAQLDAALASADVTLDEAVLAGIEEIQTRHPNPSP